jgi:arylsulfatase A-like enzyme
MDDRDDVPRQVLPIPDRKPVGLTTYDAKDPGTKFPPIQPLRPPTGAPNVLIILLDDVGFGASSAFGGPCHTPTAERLATQGLKYTRFHHFGGTRNGAIVHWPKGFTSRGELRSQFHHVIDVAPTILEAAKLPAPTFVNGVMQEPLHGVSMAYSFDDPKAAERHETQYFEMVCNRGIYHQGWTAVTRHGNLPWVVVGAQP